MKFSRRNLLVGSAASALAFGIPIGPVSAGLHLHGGGSGGNPKVNINLAITPDLAMFRNFALNTESLSGPFAFPSILDVNGYPQGTLSSSMGCVIPFPSNVTTGTSLTLAWSGTATNSGGTSIGVQGGFTGFNVTSSTNAGQATGATSVLNLFGTNGKIVFNFTGAQQSNAISVSFSGTFAGFGGFIFCASSDYNAILSAASPGDLLAPAYIAKLAGLHPRSIRMMNPALVNAGNLTQHRYRAKWQTAFGFTSNGWVPNVWAGGVGTAGPNITRNVSTNTYTASAAVDTPAVYTMGEVLQGQFDLANNGTGASQINVGGRGAVPMFDISGNTLNNSVINASDLTTMIYDDLLGGYMVYVQNEGESIGLKQGIPLEVLVAICNAVNASIWYNFAPYATYKNSTMEPTNSVSQITSYIKTNLNSNLNAYFEWANEVWNGGFHQSVWATVCGDKLGIPSANTRDNFGFHGLRHAYVMAQVTSAWGASGPGSRLIRVNAAGAYTDQGSTNAYQFQGADLFVGNPAFTDGGVKYASYVNANFNVASPTYNRPIDLTDAISYADYSQGAQTPIADFLFSATDIVKGGPPGWTTGLIGAADAFAAGGSTNIANALAFMDWDVRFGMTGLQTVTIGGDGKTFTVPGTAPGNNQTICLTPGSGTMFTGVNTGQAYWVLNSSGSTFQIGTIINNSGSLVTGISGGSGCSVGFLGDDTLLALATAEFGFGIYPRWETIAQGYDTAGARPPALPVLSVELYEGGYQSWYPSTAECTTLGISTAYGGATGKISLLLNAYKNSALFNAAMTQKYANFFATAPVAPSIVNHSKGGSHFDFGGNIWGMFQDQPGIGLGDIYTNAWQSYAATGAYNQTP